MGNAWRFLVEERHLHIGNDFLDPGARNPKVPLANLALKHKKRGLTEISIKQFEFGGLGQMHSALGLAGCWLSGTWRRKQDIRPPTGQNLKAPVNGLCCGDPDVHFGIGCYEYNLSDIHLVTRVSQGTYYIAPSAATFDSLSREEDLYAKFHRAGRISLLRT